MTDKTREERAIESKGFKEGERYSSDKSRDIDVTQTSGEMTYASLHHHTTYSYLDGFGLPEEHAEVAATLGYKSLAVTEHGNVSSHLKHSVACKARGVKPLFGCELYTAPTGVVDPTPKNPSGMARRKNHLTVLAVNTPGYRNLVKMVSGSWSEGFFQFPTTTGSIFQAHHEDLIVMSGCTASLLATSMVGGKDIDPQDASYSRARKVAAKFQALLGDRYYLEVQAYPELENVRRLNPLLEKLGEELGIPLVATTDCHVPTPDGQEMRPILHAIGRGKGSVDQLGQEFDYTIDTFIPPSDDYIYQRLLRTGLSKKAARRALRATEEIADRCTVDLPEMPMVRYPTDRDSEELCWEWMREGWKYRKLSRLSKAEQDRYVTRIKYEMDLIVEKDYVDYFLIVSDMAVWAKTNGVIVGPARGSAAGSLVCWLLRITEVNPMAYEHLIFERFIDHTRMDLPDIDLDFDDENRERVFEYMRDKYGWEHTGKVGTFTKYKSKNALDDIARLYNVPRWEVQTIKDLMIERSSGDLRASSTIEDTIETFEQVQDVFTRFPDLRKAMKLEGNYRGMGVHAGGLIVASQPLSDICAVYTRNGERVISLDKYSSADLGLLKIDVLGLTELGMLKLCCEMVGMDIDDLYGIPLDDPKTAAGFTASDVIGVFQLDGWSTQLVNDEVRPETLLEVCDVIAMSRPGPLHNGAANEYMQSRNNPDKDVRKYHPLVNKITGHTANQIVYQEQILKICTEIGNFDFTHVAYIRRIISRKIGEQEFSRQGDRFVEGAISNGLTEAEARSVWGSLITAGNYAFNFSHTVSYATLAWWVMWFKQNHPLEFFTASLIKRSKDADKRIRLMRDAETHGIKILPPDPIESSETWRREGDGAIRAGFSQVPGIGEKRAEVILETREAHPFESWDDLLQVKGIGEKTLEKIVDWATAEDPLDVHTLERTIERIKHNIETGDFNLPMPTHTAFEVPYNKSSHDTPLIWCGKINYKNLRDLFEVNFARTGVPLDPKDVRDPHLNEWMTMKSEDHTGKITLRIDRWAYPRFKQLLWDLDLKTDFVVVKAVKKGFLTARLIMVKDIWVIDTKA